MKHNQRAEKLRRSIGLGRPRTDSSLQMMSVARRFARTDRQLRPIHCDFAQKLIYDSDEIARSIGQQLTRISGQQYYLYPCKSSDFRLSGHWHLTTKPTAPNGSQNEQA